MTRRKIYFQGMRWVDDVQSKNDNTNQTPKKENKKENLTKDRKIKLDKIIKGSGFKEI